MRPPSTVGGAVEFCLYCIVLYCTLGGRASAGDSNSVRAECSTVKGVTAPIDWFNDEKQWAACTVKHRCKLSRLLCEISLFSATITFFNYIFGYSIVAYLSPSSIIWYQRKLGSKQAYHVVPQPVSRGLAVFADAWLSGWLAEISADLRETVAH